MDDLEALKTVTIQTEAGPLAVPYEECGNDILITPFVAGGKGHKQILGGGFVLTHGPTGYRYPGTQACIECCRAAGRVLAGIPVDWSSLLEGKTLADFPSSATEDWKRAYVLMRDCEQDVCEHLTEEASDA